MTAARKGSGSTIDVDVQIEERGRVENPVTVLVVDDQPDVRRAVIETFVADERFLVVGEAQTGEQALEFLQKQQVSLVLMDINMPGRGGVAAARNITERRLAQRILLMSLYDEGDLPAAVLASQLPYINKADIDPELLFQQWTMLG
jgi:DNA-binding NarL/FixJ family response regulator